eukprot:CAMPEP_0173060416 /NCGR_PEP_ID=MMETSP1102-20130122/2583_1 /TAXON_ID=49646 /ORGANISM="Geminigera sp., Strain Caron Lab Isolate" /LENGTH=124 /DNA_ID=CAMNT_0013926639 /DNA_START=463 /DNA_END=837 /DNA_ORIENTATION=-
MNGAVSDVAKGILKAHLPGFADEVDFFERIERLFWCKVAVLGLLQPAVGASTALINANVKLQTKKERKLIRVKQENLSILGSTKASKIAKTETKRERKSIKNKQKNSRIIPGSINEPVTKNEEE